MDVNARLERLERENRLMKKIGIVAAVFAAVLFISGQAKTNKGPSGTQKFSLEGKAVVEANEFRLVDASGKVCAKLSMEMTNRPTLSFYDGKGNIPASLGGGDEPFLILNRPGTNGTVQIGANRTFYGVGIYEKEIRAGLSVQKGIPGLELNDASGMPLVAIEASGSDSSLTMLGSTGNLRVDLSEALGGPTLQIEDKEGYASVLGRADLEATGTGRKTRTPAASLVLFGKDKNVLWSAP